MDKIFTQLLYAPIAMPQPEYIISNVPLEKFTNSELDELRKISEKSYQVGLEINDIIEKLKLK